MGPRWKTNRESVFDIGYHLIWCSKYRRKVFTGPVEKRLKKLIMKKTKEMGLAVESLEIMPDHVHLFVKSDPSFAPQEIVQQIKGYTSRMLRSEFEDLVSRMPCLWTRTFLCESVGSVSKEMIQRFIEVQKKD